MKKIETVALIGLGAIGCALAPGLCRAVGAENFRVIASGARKARLETQGVRINGEICRYRVAEPAEQDPADLVIVTVKHAALPQAIEDIAGQVGEHTTIISFMNGVTSDAALAGRYGWEHVLYGITRKSVVMQDGVCDLWRKFMGNIGENQVSAILGVPYGAWHDETSDASWLREAACREAIAVAQRLGVDLREEDLLRQREIVKGVPYGNKTSMLQDIEAGRKTEVEMFAGTLCRLGRENGVPTPVSDILYHMLRVLEQKNDGTIRLDGEIR